MLIRNLFRPWRRNVPLHATLITRKVSRIDADSVDLVQMDNAETLKVKLRGASEDGIEVFIDCELIGSTALLEQFKFLEGQHVGVIIRAID